MPKRRLRRSNSACTYGFAQVFRLVFSLCQCDSPSAHKQGLTLWPRQDCLRIEGVGKDIRVARLGTRAPRRTFDRLNDPPKRSSRAKYQRAALRGVAQSGAPSALPGRYENGVELEWIQIPGVERTPRLLAKGPDDKPCSPAVSRHRALNRANRANPTRAPVGSLYLHAARPI